MRLRISDSSALKKPFLTAGAVCGVLGSVWYFVRTIRMPVPDPIWLRAVNIALILFASIYVANLLRRLADILCTRGAEPGKGHVEK